MNIIMEDVPKHSPVYILEVEDKADTIFDNDLKLHQRKL